MKATILVKRYAQGFVAAITTEEEFERIFTELKEISRIFEGHPDLKIVIGSPLLPESKKKQVINSIIDAFQLADKTRRFLLLLNEHQRMGLLPEIVRYLPYAWREKRGVLVFEVRSAVPLKKEEAEELRQKLASLEGAPVHLDLVVDPEVLAGLRLKKGNIVYDASVKGQLLKMREILSEG